MCVCLCVLLAEEYLNRVFVCALARVCYVFISLEHLLQLFQSCVIHSFTVNILVIIYFLSMGLENIICHILRQPHYLWYK